MLKENEWNGFFFAFSTSMVEHYVKPYIRHIHPFYLRCVRALKPCQKYSLFSRPQNQKSILSGFRLVSSSGRRFVGLAGTTKSQLCLFCILWKGGSCIVEKLK